MGGSFSANISHESHTTEAMMDDNDMRMNCMGGAACDPSATRYGASVSIDDISLGVALLDAERTNGDDLEAVDVGIGWSQGPLSLGISHGSVEQGPAEYDITAFSGGYNLGPGVNVGARASSGEAGGNGFTQFLLGTFFSF